MALEGENKYTTAEMMDAAHMFFNALYEHSDVCAAVLRPVRDEKGEIVDVKMVTANPRWQGTRKFKFRVGMLGSESYSGWDNLLPILKRAFTDGHATQTWIAPSDHPLVHDKGDVLLVEWRLLPNGMVIETAKRQTLLAELVEATGPIMIVDLPDGPGTRPSHLLAVNRSFQELFLADYMGEIPTIAVYENGELFPLSKIRDYVVAAHQDVDWKTFHNETQAAYLSGKEETGLPFVLGGDAYTRQYLYRKTSDGRWVGIWLYYRATLNELDTLPAFQSVRIHKVRDLVKGIGRPMAAHKPVFNSNGEVVDLEILWVNDQYDSYLKEPAVAGDKASENRVRFETDFLPFVREAWQNGQAVQYFAFKSDDVEAGEQIYRSGYTQTTLLEMETTFTRTEDGYILEWGDDVDSKIRLGSDMEAQRRAALEEISRARAEVAARGEHDRFTRELHDNILQELFVLGVSLSPHTKEETSTVSREWVEDIQATISKVSQDIRSLITGSRADEEKPLTQQIEHLCNNWNRATPDFSVLCTVDSVVDSTVLDRIPLNISANLTFVTKEAIANAVKHSGGTKVSVELFITPRQIHLSITDNGNGVDPRNTRASGTLNMQGRVESIGGKIDVYSSNNGVAIDVVVPYSAEMV